jgi:cell wall-associated NlpC family hydrolase
MQVPSISGLFGTRLSSVQARLPVKLSFSQHMQQAVEDTRTAEKPAETARADRKWFSLVPDVRYALEPETALPSAEPVAETATVPATETTPQIPDGEYETLGQTLSAFAAQFVGNPYVWGAEDLVKGADCSGFTQSVFKNFGISLPRTAYAQSKVGREVETADLQPGDLLAFKNADESKVGHVGIYIGDGKFVHACNKKYGIIISDLSRWKDRLYTIRRMPELEPAVG